MYWECRRASLWMSIATSINRYRRRRRPGDCISRRTSHFDRRHYWFRSVADRTTIGGRRPLDGGTTRDGRRGKSGQAWWSVVNWPDAVAASVFLNGEARLPYNNSVCLSVRPSVFQSVTLWRNAWTHHQIVFFLLDSQYSAVLGKLYLETRNTFCGTWYLPHSHVHNERTVPIIMAGCMAHERESYISLPV